MEYEYMTVGQRTRMRRQALKLTQQELAKGIGLSPQHISAIEQDKRAPSLPSLAKLAEELGVTIDYLVTGKEGVITDTIPAIKADKTLNLEIKRALIALVREWRNIPEH
jgi:transcriptional regulator with XRE-family HTH domain